MFLMSCRSRLIMDDNIQLVLTDANMIILNTMFFVRFNIF